MFVQRICKLLSVPFLLAAFLHAANALEASDVAPAGWYTKYGWAWDIIPSGTKIKSTGEFGGPISLFHSVKDVTPYAKVPVGEKGVFLGYDQAGFCHIRMPQGEGYVDYRVTEPIIDASTKTVVPATNTANKPAAKWSVQ